MEKSENLKEEIQSRIVMDYIFVDISSIDSPRYVMVSTNEMRKLLKSSVEDWIKNSNHRRQIGEMLRTETKKQRWSLTFDEILPYETRECA